MLFKKKIEKKSYDPLIRKPKIRVSICTGEMVAGFYNVQSERFEEVMLIRNDNDLKEFKEIYSIDTDIEKFY